MESVMSEHLTKETFLEKVFDYENNKEWSFKRELPAVIDFYADWCISCKVMEKYAFTHADVLRALDRVATLQTDVTDNDAIDTQFMNSLGIYGPPALLFFDAGRRAMRHRLFPGCTTARISRPPLAKITSSAASRLNGISTREITLPSLSFWSTRS